jgi:hypothetical protein
MYDGKKLEWCKHYCEELRKITQDKFDSISAHILMFMDQHTRLSDEEIKKVKESGKSRGKGDITQKVQLLMQESSEDLSFGLWANV